MALSIYTSRLFLEVLGITDFGIYNIVGSVMVMFSFINNTLVQSSSRFLNFSLGNSKNNIKQTFSTILTVHLWISILLIILGETIGLWFLNNELNIPSNRITAANIVYQISILSSAVGVFSTPYFGVIVANEKMSIYTYISILEAISKVIILICLFSTKSDKLIIYSLSFFISSIIITLILIIYTTRKFSYCRFSFRIEKKELRQILSFSSWSILGQIVAIGSTTGLNIVINIFVGVVANAAAGIANQISSTIYRFVSNFQTAFTPQLIQSYSRGDLEEHRDLISKSTRVSYFLIFIFALPIILNIDYILKIWLVKVPQYTAEISVCVLISSLLDAIGTPIWTSIQAIGRIKTYQIVVSSVNALTLPFAALLLWYGLSPAWAFIAKLIISFAVSVFRVVYILPQIKYNILNYVNKNILPIFYVSTICTISLLFVNIFARNDVYRLIVDSTINALIIIIALKYIILSKSEWLSLHHMIKHKLDVSKSHN